MIPLALPAQAFDPLVVPVPADRPTSTSPLTKSRASLHWGYIAFYYLTEQMHRWERFVFRFDKKFASIAALKNVTGMSELFHENLLTRCRTTQADLTAAFHQATLLC